MRISSILQLAAVLSLSVYGQLAIKSRSIVHVAQRSEGGLPYLRAMFTDIVVLSGLAAAVAAGCCWMLAIQRLDLGYAYVFMALSFVLVPLGSVVLFREIVSVQQMAGIGLIVAGVALSATAR